MQRSSWTVGLYLMLVFASGMVVGAYGHRFYEVKSVSANAPAQQTPADFRLKYVNKLKDRLKLTPDQVQNLQSILKNTHQEYQDYRDRHRSEVKAIQDNQISRVKGLLTSQQQPEYQKILDEQERERRVRDERDRKSN